MCGIVGIYRFDGAAVAPGTVLSMMDFQTHRGPDDSGHRLFTLRGTTRSLEPSGPIGPQPGLEGALGFNRLSILDLSRDGHQPMADATGQVFIAFNGEIYNAPALRKPLQEHGYVFRSRTDTEVILALYLQHGFKGMLERINGMFALCVVDLRARKMLLARDRFGIKPLYWTQQNSLFAFASEIKSLLPVDEISANLADQNLAEFMQFRYTAADRTLLKNIHQLEPASWLEVTPGGITKGQYWTPPARQPSYRGTLTQAVEEMDQRLRQSVRAQLMSDVKLGCQLSGGVDSSLICMLATGAAKTGLDGIAVTFEDPDYSEESWVDAAATQARINAHKISLTAERAVEALDDATWHMDQPLNHPNCLGIYWLAKTAREHVTVLLSGEGADELLGGYYRYAFIPLAARIGSALPLLAGLPWAGKKFDARFGHDGTLSPEERAIGATACLDREQLAAVLPGASWNEPLFVRSADFPNTNDGFIANFLQYEMQSFMPDLLLRQDKMTMAHSIENRVPFLDHELLSFVATLPTEFLVKPGLGFGSSTAGYLKRVLKLLCAKYFGHDFAFRPKMGFALPLAEIFDHPRIRERMEDVILPGVKDRGLFDRTYVTKIWNNRQHGANRDYELLWTVLSFETWAAQFIDRPMAANRTRGLAPPATRLAG